MNIVELKQLNKKFGDRQILKDFDLCVGEQEMVTITGRSGAGKSTLLNIIGLLDSYTSGSALIDGEPFPSTDSHKATLLRRTLIGYIFQNYALVDDETVEENLRLALRYGPRKESKERIPEVLNKVGLENYEKKKIYELSGGEQQRVALARVFLKPCRLILADEPTGSLDVENKKLVLELLRTLRQEGKAVIIVTHDPEIAGGFDRNVRL